MGIIDAAKIMRTVGNTADWTRSIGVEIVMNVTHSTISIKAIWLLSLRMNRKSLTGVYII